MATQLSSARASGRASPGTRWLSVGLAAAFALVVGLTSGSARAADPDAPAPKAEGASSESGPSAARQASTESDPKTWKHNGFILDAGIGVLGCTRSVCGDRHGANASLGLDGFLGGNIGGIVELGVSGGWGRVTPDIDNGTNALSLYGVDAGDLRDVAAQLGVSPSSLTVTDGQSQLAHAAPMVRIHLPRRGRVGAWLGTGAGYVLYRNDYTSRSGDFRLDWHGLQVPVQGGLAVYVSRNVAFPFTGTYRFAWYLAGLLDHPDQLAAAPVGTLDQALENAGAGFDQRLPHLWHVNFGLRLTLGGKGR